MEPRTPYPHVNTLLDSLPERIQQAVGGRLVGLYLYGSLASGDYDDDTSDVDLLAALESAPGDDALTALKRMHDDLAQANMRWDDRLEIAYLSLHGLRTFKTERSPIAVISPGEPFNVKTAGKDWLVNWYVVQQQGMTLFGPPPQTLIEPISDAEFIEVVKDHAREWPTWIDHFPRRPSQAYAILTLCRALYAVRHGEQASKPVAARWTMDTLPQWRPLIENALQWRKHWRDDVDGALTFPQTKAFITFMTEQVLSS